jgi:hypothetical protein
MSTLPIPSEAVAERLQAMRISAELALASVSSSAAKNAEPLARVVAAYRDLLATTGSRIIQAQVKVIQARSKNPTDPTLLAMERKTVELLTAWTAHARGYTAYERPATEAEKGGAIAIGVAPMVVIAIAVSGAVIAVAFAGVAWAVVHYKEASVLADEIALIETHPALADAIAKVNETAPSSSPADDAAKVVGGGGFGWFLAAAGVAAAAIFIVPKLGKG